MTLPTGAIVRLDARVRTYDRGRTLVGGSPARLLRLSEAARSLLNGPELQVEQGTARVLADRLVTTGVANPVASTLPAIDLAYLTVVVPVRDRARSLDRLLDSLPSVGEVVVVDDASSDPKTVERVTGRHGASLYRMTTNRGPAACRNAGLAKARTSYVAFIDSDAVVEPATFEVALRHFGDSDVAMVAPRVVGLPANGEQGWIARYENACSSLDLGVSPGLVGPRTRIGWVPSVCLLVRRDAVGRGFDEQMRVGEDVDLVWRVIAEGWRVRYEPTVRVRHEHRTALAGWLRRKAFYGQSVCGLADRHGSAVAPAVLTPLSAGFTLAVVAQRGWSVPVSLAFWALTTARLARRLRDTERPCALAMHLSTEAAVGAISQASGLMLRHWWPVAGVAALGSRRMRRAMAVAAMVDGICSWRWHSAGGLDPLRFTVARRLEHVAYGTGAWAACVRRGSWNGLLPDVDHGWKHRASARMR